MNWKFLKIQHVIQPPEGSIWFQGEKDRRARRTKIPKFKQNFQKTFSWYLNRRTGSTVNKAHLQAKVTDCKVPQVGRRTGTGKREKKRTGKSLGVPTHSTYRQYTLNQFRATCAAPVESPNPFRPSVLQTEQQVVGKLRDAPSYTRTTPSRREKIRLRSTSWMNSYFQWTFIFVRNFRSLRTWERLENFNLGTSDQGEWICVQVAS